VLFEKMMPSTAVDAWGHFMQYCSYYRDSLPRLQRLKRHQVSWKRSIYECITDQQLVLTAAQAPAAASCLFARRQHFSA